MSAACTSAHLCPGCSLCQAAPAPWDAPSVSLLCLVRPQEDPSPLPPCPSSAGILCPTWISHLVFYLRGPLVPKMQTNSKQLQEKVEIRVWGEDLGEKVKLLSQPRGRCASAPLFLKLQSLTPGFMHPSWLLRKRLLGPLVCMKPQMISHKTNQRL